MLEGRAEFNGFGWKLPTVVLLLFAAACTGFYALVVSSGMIALIAIGLTCLACSVIYLGLRSLYQ